MPAVHRWASPAAPPTGWREYRGGDADAVRRNIERHGGHYEVKGFAYELDEAGGVIQGPEGGSGGACICVDCVAAA